MAEMQDRGFLSDAAEAVHRNLDFRYRGPERGYAQGLSLALAEAFLHQGQPPQALSEAITSELLRRGWDTNIAGAVAQAVFNAAAQGDYNPLADEVATEAQRGIAAAQLVLGGIYSLGWGDIGPSGTEAFRCLLAAAEQGAAAAQLDLGVLSYTREDRSAACEGALRWWSAAAEQGHPGAQFNLGVLSYQGWCVAESYEQAAPWFAAAAEQGDADAQFSLAFLYLRGQGVDPDDRAAARLFRRAAEQGDLQAQYNIGLAYLHGRGVVQDYLKARKWWVRAAQEGMAEAQLGLGEIFFNGYGVPVNYQEAARWLRDAADRGQADAQCQLGVMYQLGLGVPVTFYRKIAGCRRWSTIVHDAGAADAELGATAGHDDCDLCALGRRLQPLEQRPLHDQLGDSEVGASVRRRRLLRRRRNGRRRARTRLGRSARCNCRRLWPRSSSGRRGLCLGRRVAGVHARKERREQRDRRGDDVEDRFRHAVSTSN
jgi:TPR repeat protein